METKDIIRIGRTRLGMTHQAFADAVGVSRGLFRRFFYAHTFKNDSKKCELLTQ